MDDLIKAIEKCEAAVDAHPGLRRPKVAEGEMDGSAVGRTRLGWEVQVSLKTKNARANKSWHPARSYGDTLDEAVQAFVDGLDNWAKVL